MVFRIHIYVWTIVPRRTCGEILRPELSFRIRFRNEEGNLFG